VSRVVVLSPEELQQLVADAIATALASVQTPQTADSAITPELLARADVARALGVSVATVDRMRVDGLPELTVGDVPRFELHAVLEWVRSRQPSGAAGRQPAKTTEKALQSADAAGASGTDRRAPPRKPAKSHARGGAK
jgi:hypothetical protein